jgi:hypothetical protein
MPRGTALRRWEPRYEVRPSGQSVSQVGYRPDRPRRRGAATRSPTYYEAESLEARAPSHRPGSCLCRSYDVARQQESARGSGRLQQTVKCRARNRGPRYSGETPPLDLSTMNTTVRLFTCFSIGGHRRESCCVKHRPNRNRPSGAVT